LAYAEGHDAWSLPVQPATKDHHDRIRRCTVKRIYPDFSAEARMGKAQKNLSAAATMKSHSVSTEPVFEAVGIEFIDENGGGRGVRLRKRSPEKSRK
jgi:hypothetical protein